MVQGHGLGRHGWLWDYRGRPQPCQESEQGRTLCRAVTGLVGVRVSGGGNSILEKMGEMQAAHHLIGQGEGPSLGLGAP